MYLGAGRDVWSGLGITVLVGNGVGQSLWMNSTFTCVNWVLFITFVYYKRCSAVRGSVCRRPRGGVLVLSDVPDVGPGGSVRQFDGRRGRWQPADRPGRRRRRRGWSTLAAVHFHQAVRHVGAAGHQSSAVRRRRVHPSPAIPTNLRRNRRLVWWRPVVSVLVIHLDDAEGPRTATASRHRRLPPCWAVTAEFYIRLFLALWQSF